MNRKKLPTVLVIRTFLVVGLLTYSTYYAFSHLEPAFQIAVVAVFLLTLLPLARIPIAVTDTGREIIIRQLIGRKVFIKDEFKITALQSCKEHQLTIRLFASSIWLYWGYFWNNQLGIYFGQHLGDQGLVLLTNHKNGKKYLIDMPYSNQTCL